MKNTQVLGSEEVVTIRVKSDGIIPNSLFMKVVKKALENIGMKDVEYIGKIDDREVDEEAIHSLAPKLNITVTDVVNNRIIRRPSIVRHQV